MSKKEDMRAMLTIAQKLDEVTVKHILGKMEIALFVQEAERERLRQNGIVVRRGKNV